MKNLIHVTSARLLVTALLAALGTTSGCSSEAATAAVAVAAGAYIGGQIATHSQVSVEIEVYKDRNQVEGDPSHFLQKRPLAIQNGLPVTIVDPLLQPSKEVFEKVAQQAEPNVRSMEKSANKLLQTAKHLEVAPKLTEDFRSAAEQSHNAIQAWGAFKAALAKVASKTQITADEERELTDLLRAFRAKLTLRNEFRFATKTIEFMRVAIGEGILGKGDGRPEALGKVQDSFKKAAEKETIPTGVAAEQVTPYVAAALRVIMEELGDLKSREGRRPVLTEVALTLESYGFIVNADQLMSAYRKTDDMEATKAAVLKLLSQAPTSSQLGPIKEAQEEHRRAYEATFIKLVTDFNLGGIRNEVMQSLLTSPAIPDITAPNNADHWQKFAHARSQGTAGNHDVVIYFEHLGLPILKSAGFDPSKFIIANGQIFRKAFSAMAAVYGIPAGTVTTDPKTGKPLVGYNLNLADQNREAAVKSASDNQTQLLNSLEKIIKGYEDLPKPKDPTTPTAAESKAQREHASKAIQAAIDALGKPDDKKPEETKPEEKPAGTKPDDKKPGEKKPEEKQPETK